MRANEVNPADSLRSPLIVSFDCEGDQRMIAGEGATTQDRVAVICDDDLPNPKDRSGKFGGDHSYVIDVQRHFYLMDL